LHLQVEPDVFPQAKTEIKPMSKTNVGANLVFALRTKTETKPMTEIKRIGFGHRVIFGFCSRANTRFAPTFRPFWLHSFILSVTKIAGHVHQLSEL
jgi:hypothetical protein